MVGDRRLFQELNHDGSMYWNLQHFCGHFLLYFIPLFPFFAFSVEKFIAYLAITEDLNTIFAPTMVEFSS